MNQTRCFQILRAMLLEAYTRYLLSIGRNTEVSALLLMVDGISLPGGQHRPAAMGAIIAYWDSGVEIPKTIADQAFVQEWAKNHKPKSLQVEDLLLILGK